MALEAERDFLNKETGEIEMAFNSLIDIYLEHMSHRLRESTMDNKRNIVDKKLDLLLVKLNDQS